MKPINQSYDFQHNDMKNAVAVNMVVETRPADPDTAFSGQIYYNSGMKLLRVFDGTTWKSLSASGGVMTYKGTVTNWSDLPISGMQAGDYWVNSTTQTARVWNGDTNVWDDVGNATFTIDSSMSETSQNALENRIVTQEMLLRMKKLPKETFSGLEYQFPFNINPLVQTTNSITTSFDTLVLNDGQTRGHFDMAIPSADVASDKAGLYNKALADVKADVTLVNTKLDKLDNEPVSGQPYHFPFNINPLVQESNKISTSFDTITLDGNKTKINYQMSIPAADITNDKAGLYTKALADNKSKVTYTQSSTGTETIGTITIDGTSTEIKGTKVEVAESGSSTDVVNYIKVNGVEKKIGGTMDSDWSTSSENGLQNKILTDALLHAYGDGVGTIHPEHQKAIRSGSGAPTGTEIGDIYLLQKDAEVLTFSEIVGDLTTGGVDKVASAETVKTLNTNKVDKDGDKTLSKITLNGSVTQTPTIYAPITAGTNKQLVEWDGTNNVPIFTSTPTVSNITATTNVGMKRNNTTDRLTLYGGTAYNNGAYLKMGGKDYSSLPGAFALCTHDGTTGANLEGYPNGTIRWSGKPLCYTDTGLTKPTVDSTATTYVSNNQTHYFRAGKLVVMFIDFKVSANSIPRHTLLYSNLPKAMYRTFNFLVMEGVNQSMNEFYIDTDGNMYNEIAVSNTNIWIRGQAVYLEA